MDDCLIITCPDPGEKEKDEAAELFERAAKRAREGDHEKAIQQYEGGLALDVLHTTARRDLAMSRMAKGDMSGTNASFAGCFCCHRRTPGVGHPWQPEFPAELRTGERYFLRAACTLSSGCLCLEWNGRHVCRKGRLPEGGDCF